VRTATLLLRSHAVHIKCCAHQIHISEGLIRLSLCN
jgi:hypothetical protein